MYYHRTTTKSKLKHRFYKQESNLRYQCWRGDSMIWASRTYCHNEIIFTCYLKQDNKVSLRYVRSYIYESFNGLFLLQKMAPSFQYEKLNLPFWHKNARLEYARTDCWGENLDLRERNQQEDWESYIMESFLYCCMLSVVLSNKNGGVTIIQTQVIYLYIKSQHFYAQISYHLMILEK
jgi:hypothetical protein